MGFGAGCVDIRASDVTSGKERETEREREITTPHVPELKDPFFFITPSPLWSYTFVQYHKNELLLYQLAIKVPTFLFSTVPLSYLDW